MRNTAVILLVIAIAVLSGCKKTDPAVGGINTGDINSTLVSVSGCTTAAKIEHITPVAEAEECFEYSYDGEDVLTIWHFAFALNCCPGDIVATVTIDDGVITVIETEGAGSSPCDCICLYYSEIEISGIPPGQYRIMFSDEYTGPDEVLSGLMVLNLLPSGRVCEARTAYPW